jgi:hypothetical protein
MYNIFLILKGGKYIMKKLVIMLAITVTVLLTLVIAGDNGINTAKINGYKALKVFVQIKDEQIVTSDFMEYQTEHFIIKYRPEDENIIRDTARMFEDSYQLGLEKYGFKAEQRIVVVIYKDQNEFWSYQRSIQGQAVMGLYNMGTIHILSPNTYTNDKESPIAYFKKNGPVLHEYIHKVADEITGGNIELWLTEGLALYEEYEQYGIEWAPGFEYERYFNSQEMREGFMEAEETQSYRQSYDMMKYLIDVYGIEKLQLLLVDLGKGIGMNEAFTSIYGMSADEFIDSKIYVQ